MNTQPDIRGASQSSTTDGSNLSPALAAMVASIVIPHQYSAFVGVTVESINSRCRSRTVHIKK